MTNNTNTVLYIGVTNSIRRRIGEHAQGQGSSFTRKYHCTKCVYCECFPTIEQAILREKQLKHFKREWKNQLVNARNPDWADLATELIVDPSVS